MRSFWTLILLMLTPMLSVFAQTDEIGMADAMVENGKIYVVIGVLCIIFIGIIIYLISLDKRITKMEE